MALVKVKSNKRKNDNDNEVSFTKKKKIEELSQLREQISLENVFHSNLIRLQVEETLKNVEIKQKYKKLFKLWLQKFTEQVNAIDDDVEYELNDNTLCDNVQVPMDVLKNYCPGVMKFIKPTRIVVGGSFSTETLLNVEPSIDIFVEMPESLFEGVDGKNYRYMRKKAIYLACIAANLDEEVAERKCFAGDNSNQTLKIVPNGKLGKFIIYVHAVVQETAFLINKFTPDKNNVKPAWFFNDAAKKKDKNPPTPHYNNIIMRDIVSIKNNEYILECINSNQQNVRDAIKLIKIWLRQRNLHLEGMGHVMTLLTVHLLSTKKINAYMSSYQILRNIFLHLIKPNWDEFSICSDNEAMNRISDYKKYSECVILDVTGYQNIAANLSKATIARISKEAATSIEILNKSRVNSFQLLFMSKIPFFWTFDMILCINDIKALENAVDRFCSEEDKLNFGNNLYVLANKLTKKLLCEGLGKRISFVISMPRKIKEWNLNEKIPTDMEPIHLGFKFDPEYCFETIDKGPEVDSFEAIAFRNFWGAKTECHRLDGKIHEAIIWAKRSATPAQKRSVCKKIAHHLLQKKLQLLDRVHYKFYFNQLETYLKPRMVQVKEYLYSQEGACFRAINVFSNIETKLRSLKETDLPLTISGVQGCSAVFRFTEAFPPVSSYSKADGKNVLDGKTHQELSKGLEVVPHYKSILEATVKLSISGKWPEDLKAFRMTKAAFNLQIAECLREQHQLKAFGNFEYFDVMQDGFIFRFRISNDKEIGLVKEIDENGVKTYVENEESRELERNLVHLPSLTGALFGLHSRYPSFGPACCLAKRWLSAHMIDSFLFPHIAIELLMASFYIAPEPYERAQTPQVGFLRLLEYFSRENWTTDPVLVNFNDKLTHDEILEMENDFGTSRENLPALFIATPYDFKKSMWTSEAPQPMILHRVSALARNFLQSVEAQMVAGQDLERDELFSPSLSDYDLVIELKQTVIARRLQAVQNQEEVTIEPYQEDELNKVPIVDFDPVAQYLADLRFEYDEYALFFHDTFGGKFIGVLMKPQKTKIQKLTLDNAASHFYTIGKGLVETINVNQNV
ncbi:nucleolar protein 6 [Trichogramma pretiosum]|uniref:nucleolar protein 6 n=1 Tax=Trichogramma pretiosum TaxID=7493 RepID=UPI0006C9B28D|nr:nucleolar protein 6 [Trichogramma pretiosum]